MLYYMNILLQIAKTYDNKNAEIIITNPAYFFIMLCNNYKEASKISGLNYQEGGENEINSAKAVLDFLGFRRIIKKNYNSYAIIYLYKYNYESLNSWLDRMKLENIKFYPFFSQTPNIIKLINDKVSYPAKQKLNHYINFYNSALKIIQFGGFDITIINSIPPIFSKIIENKKITNYDNFLSWAIKSMNQIRLIDSYMNNYSKSRKIIQSINYDFSKGENVRSLFHDNFIFPYCLESYNNILGLDSFNLLPFKDQFVRNDKMIFTLKIINYVLVVFAHYKEINDLRGILFDEKNLLFYFRNNSDADYYIEYLVKYLNSINIFDKLILKSSPIIESFPIPEIEINKVNNFVEYMNNLVCAYNHESYSEYSCNETNNLVSEIKKINQQENPKIKLAQLEYICQKLRGNEINMEQLIKSINENYDTLISRLNTIHYYLFQKGELMNVLIIPFMNLGIKIMNSSNKIAKKEIYDALKKDIFNNIFALRQVIHYTKPAKLIPLHSKTKLNEYHITTITNENNIPNFLIYINNYLAGSNKRNYVTLIDDIFRGEPYNTKLQEYIKKMKK